MVKRWQHTTQICVYVNNWPVSQLPSSGGVTHANTNKQNNWILLKDWHVCHASGGVVYWMISKNKNSYANTKKQPNLSQLDKICFYLEDACMIQLKNNNWWEQEKQQKWKYKNPH